MLESMLRAAGLRAVARGNVGTPILEAVLDPEPYDVLAVELSSFQLHWTHSLRAGRRACLNVAAGPPRLARLDGGVRRRQGQDLRQHRGRLRLQRRRPDHRAARGEAEVQRGLPRDRVHPRRARPVACSGWSTTCSSTGPSSRTPDDVPPSWHAGRPAWRGAGSRRTSSPTRWPRPRWPAPTACRRQPCARGCGPSGPTRTGSPRWPRSTASPGSTTPRRPTRTPPRPRLAAYEHVVWVAGGLLKGADFDEPGGCRARPAARRGAASAGTGPGSRGACATRARCPGRRRRSRPTLGRWMSSSRAAAGLAEPGDTVLLAPAAPPWTCSPTTRARGDAFAAAVLRHAGPAED